ncbi:MAG: hypothetical protein A3F16_08695 [Deltaproteobacteria bacterium RIFCSPHIGHO2_12_FULL_43_9]|nr:MAG: hypothetical protein A3F16_08695 [Deltaproteobacteria bacterium RIFCSPHIGHO2_12_FULL_43_9]
MGHLSLIEKRDLLYSKNLTPELARRHGGDFLAEGLNYDALSFFLKFKDIDGLRKLVDVSLEDGDSFLFLKTYKALGEPPPPELLRKVGEKAFSLQKYYYAKVAFEHLNDAALLEKVRPFIPAVEEVKPPVGAETEV